MEPDNPTGPGNASVYIEVSPFVRLLGTPSRVKILDVLLRRHSSWLSAEEIADLAGIDQGTFSRNKGVLIELDLLHREDSGQKTTYKVNTEHPFIQLLGKAHTELLEYAPGVIEETSPVSSAGIRELVNLLERRSEENDEEDETDDRESIDLVKAATGAV